MKTFFKVVSKFYDNGRIKTSLSTVVAMEKPQDNCRETQAAYIYVTFFDDLAEAQDYLRDCANA